MPTGYTGTCKGEEWYIGYITGKDGLEQLETMTKRYNRCEIVSRYYNRVKNTYRVLIFAHNHQTIEAIRRNVLNSKFDFYEMT